MVKQPQDTLQGGLQVVLILRLSLEDVADHLLQEGVVTGVVEGAEVEETSDVEQEIVVDDVTK